MPWFMFLMTFVYDVVKILFSHIYVKKNLNYNITENAELQTHCFFNCLRLYCAKSEQPFTLNVRFLFVFLEGQFTKVFPRFIERIIHGKLL